MSIVAHMGPPSWQITLEEEMGLSAAQMARERERRRAERKRRREIRRANKAHKAVARKLM